MAHVLMPRPNSPVMHRSLGAAMRGVSEAAMPDACAIVRLTQGVYDPDTNTHSPAEESIYTGPCRADVVTPLAGRDVDAGDRQTLTTPYEVCVPVSVTDVVVGDIVRITGHHDPELAGLELHVEDVQAETLAPERLLLCTAEAREPTP